MHWLDNLGERFSGYASLVMRLGLALVFLFFAYHKLHLETFGQGAAEIRLLYDIGIGPASALNYYVGLLELAIGIMLITGWQVRLAGLLAFGMTFFIFLSYLRQQGVGIRPDLYRDLGLSATGLAIFLLGKGEKTSQSSRLSPTPTQ